MEKQKIIYLEREKYNDYVNSDSIDYISTIGKKSSIPSRILRGLLTDDDIFNELERLIDLKVHRIDLSFIPSKNAIKDNYSINVADVLMIYSKLEELTDVEKERLEKLQQKRNLDVLRKDYENRKIKFVIEGKEYEFDCSDFINVFFSSEKDFLGYVTAPQICGYNKRIFFYALNKFFKKENIMLKYFVNRLYLKRNSHMRRQVIVDFESIDAFDVKNNLRAPIALNDSLKKKIMGSMNKEYSDIEKCIYIYCRLCMIFSYDYEFLANGQTGEVAEFHMDPSRIEKIKDSSDLIVCYEFIYIYAKFLEELGLDYVIYSKGLGKHSHLNFVADKYIVSADAVSSILTGDLVNAKFRFSLKGLLCLNQSITTAEEFERLLNSIYVDALKTDKEKNVSIAEAIDIYKNIKKQQNLYLNLSLAKRVDILVEQIKYLNVKNTESLGYLMKLKQLLFTKEELNNNVSIVAMVNGKSPCLIITLNDKNYIDSKTNNYYYYVYGKSQNLRRISKNKLLDYIDRKIIKYVPGTKIFVPGIGKGRI